VNQKTGFIFFLFITITLLLAAGCSEESTGPSGDAAPSPPHSPSPADGATAQDTLVTLGWECSDPDGDDLNFTVYLQPYGGAETVHPCDISSLEVTDTLQPATEYTWRVAATDGDHTTSGNNWSFTTCADREMPPGTPGNPSPPNSSTAQPIDTDLTWECIDPNLGDSLVYDVYFGQGGIMARIGIGLEDSFCDPGILEYSTTYNWTVTAEDENGNRTESPEWSFTTEDGTSDEGVFAMLVAGRNLTYFAPALITTDGLYARFDSAYAPCLPISPAHPTAVACNEYTLEWDDLTSMYKYDRTTPPFDFLVTGETYTFDITASSTVPALSKSIEFPQCEPYVTSPASNSNVSRSGFTAAWEGYSCGGEVRLLIVASSGDTTGVDVMTENDGSYTFTFQQLSSISGPQSNCSLIMVLQNSDLINEPGYDPRSYIWARVINTTIFNFID